MFIQKSCCFEWVVVLNVLSLQHSRGVWVQRSFSWVELRLCLALLLFLRRFQGVVSCGNALVHMIMTTVTNNQVIAILSL